MSEPVSLEGLKKIIFFPFHGKNLAMKWLIGTALYLANFIIPIIPLIPLYGYGGQIAKRILIQNEDPELPEWKDWGLLFSDGIKLFGASILYILPGILLIFGGYFLFFFLNFITAFSQEAFSSSGSVSPVFWGSMLGAFGGMAIMILGILVSMAGSVLLPPVLSHVVVKGEFKAAFRVKEWWPILKNNLGGFLLALVVMYGVSMTLIWVAYLLNFTIVLMFVMPLALLVSLFLMNAIQFSLFAVPYRDSVRKQAAEA